MCVLKTETILVSIWYLYVAPENVLAFRSQRNFLNFTASEWDEVINGCIEAAGLLVVAAFNRVKKEQQPIKENSQTEVFVNLKKVPEMYKEDMAPLIQQHKSEWRQFTKIHFAELFTISEDMNHWRRAQVFRGTRIAFAAQAKVARIIAPILLSNFASKTGQPLGFAPSLLQLLNPIITNHFDICKRISSDLAAPLFVEVDKDDDDVILRHEVQIQFFSKLFELSSDITFIHRNVDV